MAEQKIKIKQPQANKREIIRRILNIAFWVVFILLLSIWLTDFFKIQNGKNPIFCINKKTHEFNDGDVKECVGLGYKVYSYDRSSMPKAMQFSPFFVKMKQPQK